MAKHPAKCPRCGNRLEFDTAVDEKLVCSGCQVLLTFPGKIKPSDKVDPLIGQTLGQYEITDLLGRGGMGAVYKARQPSLGRFVAVKVLPRALLREASFLERFIREARDAASVNHPNIIQIYDVGQDKGFQYIAMECVEGESLADLLKREGPLPADRALELMKQVVAALVKAHAAGIVHRDIKPSNILLTTDGHAKVADFGLAKRTGTDVSVTHTGQAMGTPLYWPPEVARGGRADARADLYSLGATFYHLLAGRPPFEGGNAVELAIKQSNDLPTPLEDLAPDTPLPLSRIIHRLLAKNPADRLQTAAELQDALDRLSLVVPPSGGLSSLRSSASQRRPGGSAGRSQAELGNEEVSPAGAEARGREAAEARGRDGTDGEPTVRMPSALRPSLDRATAGLPSRADRGESGAPAVQQGAATGTLPGAAHVPLAERRHVKTRQRRKLLLFGFASGFLVLLLVLVLVFSSSPRPQATIPPASSSGPPTPTTHHPTPPSPPPTPKTDNRQPKTGIVRN